MKKRNVFCDAYIMIIIEYEKVRIFFHEFIESVLFFDEPTAVYNRLHGEDNNHKRKAHKHTHTWRVNKNYSFGLL